MEREQAAEQAASNSFSIGSSMTLKPAEPSREVEINGGALAGRVAAIEEFLRTEVVQGHADRLRERQGAAAKPPWDMLQTRRSGVTARGGCPVTPPW